MAQGNILDNLQNLQPSGAFVRKSQTPKGTFGGDLILPNPPVTPRKGVRKNPNGSVSTHLMAREFIPGRGWVAFPTLFQDEQGKWIDLGKQFGKNFVPIFQFASDRGEVFDFGNDVDAAIDFADKGNWKANLGIK